MYTKPTIKFVANKTYRVVTTCDVYKNTEAKCLAVTGNKVTFNVTTEETKTGKKLEVVKELTAIISLEEHSSCDIQTAIIAYNDINLVVYATSVV